MTEKKTFEQVVQFTEEIIAGYSARDALFKEVDDTYLLEEVGMPDKDWVKVTMSPDARNKALGAVRLLTASDPKWTVPRDKNKDQLSETIASTLEKAAAMMWSNAGTIRKTPIHYNACLSAILYGEIDIAVISINEIIKKETNPAKKKRLQKMAAKTPIIWEVLSPKVCYPVFDVFGLAVHVVYKEIKVIDAINRIGEVAQKQLESSKITDLVEFYEYWDEELHVVWFGGQEEPVVWEEHGLPVIPIASAVVEGGDLFDDDDRWQPFLYTTIKGKLHIRDSLIMTLMYSNAFATGANPVLVYETNSIDKPIRVDYDTPGGVLKIERGESLTPLKREAIDQSMKELYQITQQKSEESTIYSQTLGEPLGGNAPYSMVALLSQSGRLPLIPYQRMTSSTITDAMEVGLEVLRSQGVKKFKVGQKDTGIDLDLKQVPEDIELVATLEIEMPQDEFTQARTALQLVQAELVSKERARERYLNIGQSDTETRQIYKEKYVEFLAQLEFQKKQQEAQMQMQQQMQQGMQGLPPGQGQIPGQMPPGQMPPGQGQPTPEQMAQLQQMMAQQGQMQGNPDQAMMEGMGATPGQPAQMPQQVPGQNPEEGIPPEMMGGM